SFGGLDRDLELRLLILLDAKERARVVPRVGTVAVDLEVIDAQRRLVPELIFSLRAAEFIGGERERLHFRVLGIVNLNLHIFAGARLRVLAILELPNPYAEFHGR